MALSDQFTLAQIRAMARRELLDPNSQWWSNAEIDQYTNDWNDTLQSQFEFVWSTATLTFTDTTTQFQLSSIAPDCLRLDGVWFCAGSNAGTAIDTSTGRLSPRTMADLDTFQRDWRATISSPGINPIIVYQQNAQSISFWPPPAGTGTVYFEYPAIVTMTTNTSTMCAPGWARYSAISYILYRAYARFSSTQNLGKAARYRKAWERQFQIIQKNYAAYWPDRSEMLRPGRKWAGNVLRTKPAWPIWQ